MADLKCLEVRAGDCGCKEEVFLCNGIDLLVHIEPDGRSEAFLDWGDTDDEAVFETRGEALAWAARRTGCAL